MGHGRGLAAVAGRSRYRGRAAETCGTGCRRIRADVRCVSVSGCGSGRRLGLGCLARRRDLRIRRPVTLGACLSLGRGVVFLNDPKADSKVFPARSFKRIRYRSKRGQGIATPSAAGHGDCRRKRMKSSALPIRYGAIRFSTAILQRINATYRTGRHRGPRATVRRRQLDHGLRHRLGSARTTVEGGPRCLRLQISGHWRRTAPVAARCAQPC